jgi:putative ABC transport system permease protein
MLAKDFRYGFRMLVKDPWFTLVASLALGLGIGLNTTVFTFVNAVLIRGLPYDRPEEIFVLNSRDTATGDESAVSYPDFVDWRAQTKTFSGLGAFQPATMNLSDSGHPPERASGVFVTANTFSLLGQPLLLGRDFAPNEDQKNATPVVILSHGLWKSRYGSDPTVVGRSVKINETSCTIIGVMPEGMRFPMNADLWRPFVPDANLEKRDSRQLAPFGRLASGVTRTAAQAELSGIAAQLREEYPDTNKTIDAKLETFNERFNGGPIRAVFLTLLGAVGFVLLIACANVANLLLARSATRAREVAVRIALGAGRLQIVRQLLIESTLLACLGGLLGFGLAYVGVGLFDAAVANVGKPYWIKFTMDWRVFGFMALVCLATGIIFGLAPALQVSRTNVNEIIKEGGRGTSASARSRRLASAMVVAELALTLVLLVGAGLMVRSFLKLYALNLGFETNRLLTMSTVLAVQKYPGPDRQRQFVDAMLQRVRALPGANAAAIASSLPLNGGNGRTIDIEGRPTPDEKQAPRVSVVTVSPGYFDVLGAKPRAGRDLTDVDGTPGSEVVVVNERFVAKYFEREDPLGHRVRFTASGRDNTPSAWLTIVGIIPNIRQGNPQAIEADAVLYQPYRQRPSASMNLMIRAAGDPSALTTSVRQAVQAVDPDQPVFNVRTLDELLAQSRWPYRVFGSMFTIFAIIALVLSAVGIYAVTAYSVTQRTAEIGVRMALGAQPTQLSWLILKQGLWQLGLGLTLGLAAAWPASKALQSLVAQISTTDPVTFSVIAVVLTVVMLIACIIPARRAMRLDPLAALRAE